MQDNDKRAEGGAGRFDGERRRSGKPSWGNGSRNGKGRDFRSGSDRGSKPHYGKDSKDGRSDNRGPRKEFRKDGERRGDNRGPRKEFKRDGQRRDGGRDFRKDGERRSDNRGPRREFNRDGERRSDNRGPRNGFKRDGERSYGDRGPRKDGERRFDDRKPHKDFKRDGERRDGERRFDDRRPRGDFKRDDAKRDGERRFGDRGPRKDGERRFDNRGPRNDDRRDEREERAPRRERPARVSPARKAALNVVRMLRERHAFAQELISKYIDSDTRMSKEDRAFATRLVLGVVSTKGTLDYIIDRCLSSVDDVRDNVRDALQVSTYEIIFLEKAEHAAVDQGVELVRYVEPRATGLANAVLHQVVRERAAFPYGDPRSDLAALARVHGFPLWLAERLQVDLGPKGAHAFMRASNEPAPVYVGVNAAKITDAEVFQLLAAAHGEPSQVEVLGAVVPGCIRVENSQVLLDGRVKRLLSLGCILISDAASQLVASSVLPDEEPESVLEIGAGRGTKTILLQSDALRKYGHQIERFVALDNLGFKTKLLSERIERFDIGLERIVTGDAKNLDASLDKEMFDFVFIDAPCSGLGTLRRHAEIRWRVGPESIDGMAKTGLEMLKSAASHVNVGGTLAFATCTVTHEENTDVVKAFLTSPQGRDFKLQGFDGKACIATQLSSGGCDAHFAVKMVRER